MRSHFSSSKLVRLLGEASLAEGDASKQDVAERLSQWVGVFDAITLHAAHQSIQPVDDGAPTDALRAMAQALEAQYHQVQSVLTHVIQSNEVADANENKGRPPRLQRDRLPEPEAAPAPVADFVLLRQRHLDKQRKMELMVGPLRAHVRQALSAASEPLRQLAALDAVWEQMLEAREQKQLATVPGMLKRRFEELRQASHAEALGDGWLDAFGKEQQDILLAELDVRLQPVLGLIEALKASAQRG